MTPLTPAGRARLLATAPTLRARYAAFVEQGLTLDMTRGKPSAAQLDLSAPLLTDATATSPGGVDCRNYGGLEGLPEARALMGALLGAPAAQTVIGGNASLTLMHDCLVRALTHGVPGGAGPWFGQPIKWLCPSPGYDRHFHMTAHFGIELIPVAMHADGPDVDQITALTAHDPSVKGMWLVPRYSNPTGATCSEAVVTALAQLKPAAPDFRIFCDDAYAEHHLVDDPGPRPDLLGAAAATGHPDRVLLFGSTSKITFAGAGISALAASPANIAWFLAHQGLATIGPDKLSQLRHVNFLKDIHGLQAHMRRHAALLRPKFDAVLATLDRELTGVAAWSRPEGGYFISLDTPDGCAARTVALAAQAGVKLTPAGATFPYGRDPRDRNLRLAPSLPPLPEVTQAAELLALCVQLAALEQLEAAGAA